MKEAYFDPALQKPLDVIEADILFEAMNLPMRKFERDAVGTESVVPDTEKVTTSALGVGDVQPARLEKCNLLFHRQRRLSEMNFSQNFPQEARADKASKTLPVTGKPAPCQETPRFQARVV